MGAVTNMRPDLFNAVIMGAAPHSSSQLQQHLLMSGTIEVDSSICRATVSWRLRSGANVAKHLEVIQCCHDCRGAFSGRVDDDAGSKHPSH